MKRLYVYGNGGEGKEVAAIAQTLYKYDEIVFINDFDQNHDFAGIKTVPFKGIQEFVSNIDEFAVAVGEPYDREILFQKIQEKQYKIASLIAYANFQQHETVKIGAGTVIHQNVIVGPEAVIGKNCLLNTGAIVGHNVEIGNHSVVSPGAIIGGFAHINDGAYIGSGAVIRDRVTIGSGCIVGMGSVVTKNVADNVVVAGNPAKYMRDNITKYVFKRGANMKEQLVETKIPWGGVLKPFSTRHAANQTRWAA